MIGPDHEDIMPGRFVVTSDGRIGVVSFVHLFGVRRVRLQFGPDGPSGLFSPLTLRWATEVEAADSGLAGVGHVRNYASPALDRLRRRRRA